MAYSLASDAKKNFKPIAQAKSTANNTLNNIRLILFAGKLSTNLLYFITLLSLYKTASLLKAYKVMVFLYLILFSQILLIIFTAPGKPSSKNLISHSVYTDISENLINKTQIKTYDIKFHHASIQQELKRYETKNVLGKEKKALTHRDQLINQALLYLSLNQKDKFREKILQAKQLDPNWEGWQQIQ